MVARVKPQVLTVVFERESEKPSRIEVTDGRKALLRAISLLATHRELQAGDRLTVTAAE